MNFLRILIRGFSLKFVFFALNHIFFFCGNFSAILTMLLQAFLKHLETLALCVHSLELGNTNVPGARWTGSELINGQALFEAIYLPGGFVPQITEYL